MDTSIKTITVVGCGVIGSGWIARFLAHGYKVIATDPAPNAAENVQKAINHAWESLEKQGLSENASKDRLVFEPNFEKAIKQADFIQENAPEREQLKKELLSEIDRLASKDVIIASSTSGYKPSTLQEFCNHHPERVIVAHPFNPVYLIPLVEIVRGEQTEENIIEQAERFYTSVSMIPLIVRSEIEGHIADRLMEALWREALHLVNDGVATTEEVDAAIVYGPGLRWALMGPFLTFHLAGGSAGMRHMLHQFGPTLKLPWTKLEAPELTDDLIERIVEGTQEQSGQYSIQQLEERRDEFLIELQQLLKKYWPAHMLSEHK